MSNQSSSSSSSSSYPILFVSFNQDNSGFAVSTKDGFKIFDSSTGRLCYERAMGAFSIVEMLYSSSLLAIVGAGEQPSLSPRRLCLFNTTTGTALRELNFLTSVQAVRLNKKRLVIVLREKTYIYEANTLAILETIDTIPNLKGADFVNWYINLRQLLLFRMSKLLHHELMVCSDFVHFPLVWMPASWLYLPVQPKDLFWCTMSWSSTHTVRFDIDAHRAPLAAIVLSSNGMYIATASEQGTIIRVFLVSEATKSYSFRRGTYPSTIFSLSFGPSIQFQDILVATSSSGSVHVFSLGFAINQRRVRRTSSFLGSILPESVNEVLDPAHHHVLHIAFPAGVKSYAVVRKVEKVPAASSAEFLVYRASISIITYNGYFVEYIFSINNHCESTWTLEREFNLLQ